MLSLSEKAPPTAGLFLFQRRDQQHKTSKILIEGKSSGTALLQGLNQVQILYYSKHLLVKGSEIIAYYRCSVRRKIISGKRQ